MTLSAVVHVNGREGAAALDETLFSLAIQDWRDVEVVVALAAAGDELQRHVIEAVEAQPWPDAPRYKLVSSESAGGGAGRGALLNRAVEEAAGRFLTFLDAGREVVYQHGYAALIGRLAESGRGVAVGACRSAHVRGEAGREFVETKDDFTLDGSPLSLFGKRHTPVCAHVIDRSRVAADGLRFAESAGDERDFLARLYVAAELDFSSRHVFVCERRLRAGGLGGILYAAARGARRLRGRLAQLKARV
jgi:hypothetical protein